jgi:hypothetical protein
MVLPQAWEGCEAPAYPQMLGWMAVQEEQEEEGPPKLQGKLGEVMEVVQVVKVVHQEQQRVADAATWLTSLSVQL